MENEYPASDGVEYAGRFSDKKAEELLLMTEMERNPGW